jgi:trk system potassium uptake protein TrkA
MEATVSADSLLNGRMLKDAQFPDETLLVAIVRGGEAIFPRATTVLTTGDRVSVLSSPRSELAVRQLLGVAD